MEQQLEHKKGEYLVHQHHGVGKFKGKKTMSIGGEENTYYQMEMERSTLFIPADRLTAEWFRPLASDEVLDEVKDVLARPPKIMAQNFNTRKSKIQKILAENSLVNMARAIRDLSGRRRRRKTLSKTEDSFLRQLKDRLLTEWSVASGLDQDEAREKLGVLLDNDPPAS